MARWWIYLKERFPLPVYALLVGGMALSGAWCVVPAVTPGPVALAAGGLLLFFAELRVMDELKDYRKDCVAHPERPLPRGLVRRTEARRAVGWLFAGLLGWCGLSAAVAGPAAGLCFGLVCVWLYLMYREFFVGPALAARPLLYAVLHQIILLPVMAYPALCLAPEAWQDHRVLALGTAVLGAFFAYEVCRKLDPRAHPVLETYLTVYGPRRTSVLALAACGVAALGATALHLGWVLWPIELLVAITLLLIVWRPAAYKWVELMATLSLLAHLWVIPALHLVGELP